MRVPKGVGLGTRRLPGTRSECPLMAISRRFEPVAMRSALPPKADIGAMKSRQRPSDVCFNKPDARVGAKATTP